MTTLYDPDKLNYLQGFADIAAPVIEQAATRLTLHVDRRSILSGDSITVSGDLSWEAPAGWTPTANATVGVDLCQPTEQPPACTGGNLVGTLITTTDDRGRRWRTASSPRVR